MMAYDDISITEAAERALKAQDGERKVASLFRLNERRRAKLKRLSKKWKMTQTEIIELALDRLEG